MTNSIFIIEIFFFLTKHVSSMDLEISSSTISFCFPLLWPMFAWRWFMGVVGLKIYQLQQIPTWWKKKWLSVENFSFMEEKMPKCWKFLLHRKEMTKFWKIYHPWSKFQGVDKIWQKKSFYKDKNYLIGLYV